VKILGPSLQTALFIGLVAVAVDVNAQTAAPLVRGDLAGSAGWLVVAKELSADAGGKDWHGSAFGAASAGWYWTDHLKTEIDVGAGTGATAYHYRQVTIEGRPNYLASESTFSRRSVGLSQQYQFFRNTWFHPHVAAGAHVTWERVTERYQPVFAQDTPSRGRVLIPERTEGPRTDTAIRPFVATGFKAYMTQRSFFRSDLRLAFHRGHADEVRLLFGFGVDF
jgi:hypothetical protein